MIRSCCTCCFSAALIVVVLMQAACSSTPAAASDQFDIHSEILGESRTIQIALPIDYADTTDAYPVLIVLDGGSYFNYFVSVISMISPHHLPEMIVVGIPNTDRYRDLDPMNDSLGEPGEGAARFRQFLAKELIPHLNQRFRTHPHRILAGHSLAGASALSTFAAEPALFQAYIATSPSIRDQRRLTSLQRAIVDMDRAMAMGKFVFISGGGDEGPELSEAIRDVEEDLRLHNDGTTRIETRIYPGEGHFPIKGFYEALRLHFAGWFPREEFDAMDWPAIERHYAQLTIQFEFPIDPPAGLEQIVADRAARQ